MAGRIHQWQERTRAAEKRRRSEDAEVEALRLRFPWIVRSPGGLKIRLKPAYSGAPPDLDVDGIGIGIVLELVLMSLAWVRFRDGWTVWITAEGFHRTKFRYNDELAALRDGLRLERLIEEQGTAAVGLRATARTARRMRRDAAWPEDRRPTRKERRFGRGEAT